jgi:hypothetical protein
MHRLTRRIPFIAAAAALLAGGAVQAHHSFAMFDMSKEKVLTGTIKTFEWTNPHTWIYVNVPEADGSTGVYGIEGQSPNFWSRRGWSKSTLKPGDKVTVVIRPLKDGSKGGMFMRITLANGEVKEMAGAASD